MTATRVGFWGWDSIAPDVCNVALTITTSSVRVTTGSQLRPRMATPFHDFSPHQTAPVTGL